MGAKPELVQELVVGIFKLCIEFNIHLIGFLIPRVLQHLKFAKSESKLIVPYWTSAPCWPLLVTHEGSFQSEIVDFMIIMPRHNLFIPAVLRLSMFSSNIPSFYLLALRFCFCVKCTSSFGPYI